MKGFKLMFGFMLMHLFLFGFTKTKTGAKTAPRAPKLSYFDRRAPQLSARVNHGTSAACVIGDIKLVHLIRFTFPGPYYM